MAHQSTAEDLALHGLRVLGYAEAPRIAGRYRLDPGEVQEYLLDHEARGWVRKTRFGGNSGWSLTDAGRAEDERRLAAELAVAGTGARDDVVTAHQQFLPLNDRLGTACTNWQIRPAPGEPLAANDHTDLRWDDRVLATLASLGASLHRVCEPLAGRQPVRGVSRAVRHGRGEGPGWAVRLDRRAGPGLLPSGVDPVPRGPAGHARPRSRSWAVTRAATTVDRKSGEFRVPGAPRQPR